MSNKEDILKRYRANVREQFDMPDLSDIKAITYPDPLVQFIKMTESVGGHVIEVKEGQDINELVKEMYPDAKEIASNLPEITIATRNPDTVGRARDLNGTDVGIIRGQFGVAENACVWIPQTMKEKATRHPVAEVADREQHARGLQAHRVRQDLRRLRHVYQRPVEDGRHRTSLGDGSAGCEKRHYPLTARVDIIAKVKQVVLPSY